MKALGALVFAFVCVVKCTLRENPDGDPKSKAVILGISAVCYDPKDVCNFNPCGNGGTCSSPDDGDNQPYKCHCFLGFGGASCENRLVSLKVEKTKPREAELSVTKTNDAHWAVYITELVNLRNTRPLESRWHAEPGRATKITLSPLEPGTPYRVRVRPVENFREPQKWIDEATFTTPVELKIDNIHERQAVLSVTTSNSTEWSNYTVQLTNRRNQTTVTYRQNVQPGNVTAIHLARLDPDSEYNVRVTPVQDGKEHEGMSNNIVFWTLGTPPLFTKVPRNVEYFVTGENATIECSASGAPKPAIHWTRSESPLPLGRSQQQDGKLSITGMQIRDLGNYTCKASNKRGVNTTTTEFVVRPPGNCNFDRNSCGFTISGNCTRESGSLDRPHHGTQQLVPVTGSLAMCKGGHANLTTTITLNGRSCLSFDYEFNFYDMALFEVTVDGMRVLVESRSPFDGGVYNSVFHLNGAGKKQLVFKGRFSHPEEFVKLDDVQFFDCVAPSFTKVPENVIRLYPGHYVSLDCQASGVPYPTVEWTRSLLPLPQGRSQQSWGRLDMKRLQVQDSGNYTCTASNGGGVITMVTELLVREYYFSRLDSLILRYHPDSEQKLNEYLEPVKVSERKWKLCYRASDNGYSAPAFHAACDNKGPTVTLVRVEDNVFGGYTDKSWNGNADQWIYSDKAFLFSLKNRDEKEYKMAFYQNAEQTGIMGSGNDLGPVFGWEWDLHIAYDCHTNTISRSELGSTFKLPDGYTYRTPQARSLLAGSYFFTCNEYEVFYQQ